MFARAQHLYSPWASTVQSTRSYPTSVTSILLLSCHLRRDFQSIYFLRVSSRKLNMHLSSPSCVPHDHKSHQPWFAHTSNIQWHKKFGKLLDIKFFLVSSISSLPSTNTSSPSYSLTTLRLCSSFKMKDRVSHPYNHKRKIYWIFLSYLMSVRTSYPHVCVLADMCQGTLKEGIWLWYNFNWSARLPTFKIFWKHKNKVFRKKWIDFSSSRRNSTINFRLIFKAITPATGRKRFFGIKPSRLIHTKFKYSRTNINLNFI